MFGRAEPAHLQRRGAPAHLYTRLMLLLRALTLLALCGAAIATNAAGLAFLTANKAKEGVVELPSGLQYKVLRKGSGDSHPTVNSPCECHYEGRSAGNYPDGPKFDSSYDRGSPTTFAPNQGPCACPSPYTHHTLALFRLIWP